MIFEMSAVDEEAAVEAGAEGRLFFSSESGLASLFFASVSFAWESILLMIYEGFCFLARRRSSFII